MNPKKILSLLLSAALLLCVFSGCGEKDPDPYESSIYVPKVEGSGGDFMRGMDVSSLLAELESGVKYYDFDGNELDGPGFFKFLAACDVNWIRLRVWNDPYDSNGNSYGGGHNDIDTAVTLGKWATEAGMKVLIDFHYSDFWADPSKQQSPKAWQDMLFPEEKEAALQQFTYDSLMTLLNVGVDVGMVQIGNEINNGLAGEKNWNTRCKLLSAGSKGVRAAAAETNTDILVAVHFTNPNSADTFLQCAEKLAEANVDYDVFASSYYPYWHGTLENLTSLLKTISETYGKQVCVAETSWAYTFDEMDGSGNSVSEGNTPDPDYTIDIQGQALELSAVAQAVKNVGDAGIGVFYWEPAWIPVRVYDGTVESWQTNSAIWEQYGSGWASSYAAEYDPEDAGIYYGGSAVDNQALFDATGHPLESLQTYKYMQAGTTGFDITVSSIEAPKLDLAVGEALALPETIRVTFNYGDPQDLTVTWNEADVAAVDIMTPGTYVVNGTCGESYTTTCTISVAYVNLVVNPSLEDEDLSMYTVSVSEEVCQRSMEDPSDGTYSLHFYDTSAIDFTAEQTLTLEPGDYYFTITAQGGDMGDSANTYAFVRFGGEELTAAFELTGWRVWAHPEIRFTVTETTEVTFGVHVTAEAKAWGSFDMWYLCLEP